MADKYDADKYSELERLARAATKAPWFFNPNAGDDGELYSVTHRNQRNPGLDVAFTHVAHDAKFIAAANPAVVLDLIAELRRLRAALSDLDELTGKMSLRPSKRAMGVLNKYARQALDGQR